MARLTWTVTLAMVALAGAGEARDGGLQARGSHEAIVQIGGRHCEYRRSEVEGALRQFDGVQQVDFLNDHGTVKVVYRGGAMAPEELAQAVERALAMGWGCKAWVERSS